MERVTLRVPKEDVRKLEALVEVGYNPSRSDGFREAVSEYVDGVDEDPEAVDAFASAYLEDDISYDVLVEFLGAEKAKEIRNKLD